MGESSFPCLIRFAPTPDTRHPRAFAGAGFGTSAQGLERSPKVADDGDVLSAYRSVVKSADVYRFVDAFASGPGGQDLQRICLARAAWYRTP